MGEGNTNRRGREIVIERGVAVKKKMKGNCQK